MSISRKYLDDRVRAISLAMGMVPIIWTQTSTGAKFDTNGLYCLCGVLNHLIDDMLDWRVAGGTVPGNVSVATFESILGNATTLDTGYLYHYSLRSAK